MDISEVKRIIETYRVAGKNRAQTVAMVGALPLDGVAADAYQYVDVLYETAIEKADRKIIITSRQLDDKTTDALNAIVEANDPPRIFRHAGGLARVDTTEEGQPIIRALNESAARGELARVCDWYQMNAKSQLTPTAPPLEVVRDLLSMPSGWPGIPIIRAITENPVIRHDGTILRDQGYDATTFLYYQPSANTIVPEIPELPTTTDITKAKDLLCEVFCDFPFDSEISRTNILAALMTPIVRPLIKGPTPLCVIDKPQVGSGASLIATVIAIIATGRSAAVMTAPRDPDEWRKTIISTLMQGRGVVLIDNVEGSLYDSNLAAVLTATVFAARILGSNEVKDFPNLAMWMTTGNNVALGGDLPRRAYLVHIDAGVARPWLRDTLQFRHPELEKWVMDSRGRILAAILTVARAWIVAGKPLPEDLPRLGGYESWVRVVGGILAYIDIRGFLGNLSEMYERNDSETPLWTAFVAAWYERFGDKSMSGAELLKVIATSEDFEATLPIDPPRRDKRTGAIDDGGFTRKLGKALSSRKGRIYPGGDGGDYRLVAGKTKQRAQLWSVVKGKFDSVLHNIGANSLLFVPAVSESEFPTMPVPETKKSHMEYGSTSDSLKHTFTHDSRLTSKLTFTPTGSKSEATGTQSEPVGTEYPEKSCPECDSEEYGLRITGQYYCTNCGRDAG
jgi:hypothetical protein